MVHRSEKGVAGYGFRDGYSDTLSCRTVFVGYAYRDLIIADLLCGDLALCVTDLGDAQAFRRIVFDRGDGCDTGVVQG